MKIDYVIKQSAQSFLLSAGVHYLFKRNKNLALLSGAFAAGLTLIESTVYATGEYDDEWRIVYKIGFICAAAIGMTFFSKGKVDLFKSILPSLFFYQSNRYFVWLK